MWNNAILVPKAEKAAGMDRWMFRPFQGARTGSQSSVSQVQLHVNHVLFHSSSHPKGLALVQKGSMDQIILVYEMQPVARQLLGMTTHRGAI